MNKVAHQLTAHVKLLHKVAVIWQDHVLLLHRPPNDTSRPDKWDVPGGNSEWPTDLEENILNPHLDDVAREIIEETGLLAQPTDFTHKEMVHFETYFDYKKQIYTVLCGWRWNLKTPTQPVVQLSKEHTEFAWVTHEQLEQFDFGFADFIPHILRAALAS